MAQGGQGQGLAMVYRLIQSQAAMLSFNDIYRMLCVLLLLMVPVTFLLGRTQGPTGAAH